MLVGIDSDQDQKLLCLASFRSTVISQTVKKFHMYSQLCIIAKNVYIFTHINIGNLLGAGMHMAHT